MGNAVPNNHLYNYIRVSICFTNISDIYLLLHLKNFVERIASLMIDATVMKELFTLVDDAINGTGGALEGVKDAAKSGIQLLQTLAPVFPHCFKNEEVLEFLTTFVENDDDDIGMVAFDFIFEFYSGSFNSLHNTTNILGYRL